MANVSSNNLTTLYSGSGVNIRPTSAYGNSNVVALLNAGTDGANTVTNIVATGTVTAGNVSTPTVYNNGMQVQGYDYVQMQYSNAVTLPVSPYDIGTGSWFYLDAGGAVWQSNTTGTLHTVTLGNDGNVTANYFIGNVVGNITGNANYAAFAGNVTINAQPNITSLGTLTGLTSNGTVNFANAANVNLGSNSNIHISGGAANYALITDGAGNLSWGQVANAANANYANFAGNLINGTSNVNINGSGGNISISVGGVANVATFANNSINLNYPINTPNNVFIGNNAGNRTVAANNFIAIGSNAGTGTQSSDSSIAIGANAGTTSQGRSIAIGGLPAAGSAGFEEISIGYNAGSTNSNGAVSIGAGAAARQDSVAIGRLAGNPSAGGRAQSVAVGTNAGRVSGNYSVAVGYNAGTGSSTSNNSVSVGYNAGWGAQSENTVAIGSYAGYNIQGVSSIAIGANAGVTSQGNNSIILNATGSTLNQTTANTFTVKPVRNANTSNIMFYNTTSGEISYDIVGNLSAGNANFANYAGNVTVSTQSNITLLGTLTNLIMSNSNVHLGTNASTNSQGTSTVAIGNSAAGGGTIVTHTYVSYDPGTGELVLDSTTGIVAGMTISGTGFVSNQFVYQVVDGTTVLSSADPDSTPSGTLSFNSGQQTDTIAIGHNSGNVSQLANSISIGTNAGASSQQYESIAIGSNAAANFQGFQSIAIGLNAGSNSQSPQAVAIGYFAGNSGQGQFSFAMGYLAGSNNQGSSSVAVGANSGVTTQGTQSVAIGQGAGKTNQGGTSIAIGSTAGQNAQSGGAIAIGGGAGNNIQGANSVAIGRQAGFSSQGANSVAIGRLAGNASQAVNSIILNATGAALNQTTANTFTVKPVRNANTSNVMFYNNSTGEISYDLTSNITSVGNLVSLTINNGNVSLPTQQFNPNGITVGSTANANLYANSYFVDIDYGNGQADGNLARPKTQTYLKARGNATTTTTAALNDVVARTNYMLYNGTSNVLAAATYATSFLAFNSNANAVTTAGTYNIVTSSNYGDQANANALSNQNLFTFDQNRLTMQAGAAGGTSTAIAINTYGGATGGNASQSQGVLWQRYRGNRDSNLSVQPGDQLGFFSFLGYNGNSVYSSRVASLQGIVDSSYTAGNTVIPVNFNLTAAGLTDQNNNFIYGNGDAKFGLYGNGNFIPSSTVFVRNLNANNNANISGNLNVTGTISYNTRSFGSFTSNVTQTNSNVGNAIYMTLNNDEGSNGVSVVSSTQITTARVGNYNIQFSAQMEKTDAGTDAVEIWLTKNGSPVANSATRLQIQGANEKDVAAWNWLVQSANVNDYYQIAWASTDANMELVAIGSGSTLSGVAVPSVIVTVVPVGA